MQTKNNNIRLAKCLFSFFPENGMEKTDELLANPILLVLNEMTSGIKSYL